MNTFNKREGRRFFVMVCAGRKAVRVNFRQACRIAKVQYRTNFYNSTIGYVWCVPKPFDGPQCAFDEGEQMFYHKEGIEKA